VSLYVPDTFTQIMRERANSVTMGIFFRLATTPIPLRVWMGITDFPTKRILVGGIEGQVADVTDLGYESIDPAGELYLGMGRMLGMPDIEVSNDGQAPRMQIQLSGLEPEHIALLDPEVDGVAGCEAKIGIAPLDEFYQPLHTIIPLQTAYADVVEFTQDLDADPRKGGTQTVAVSIGSGDGRRAIPRLTSWTHAQHQLIHPGDDFFKAQGRYIQGLRIGWPPA